MNTFIILVLFPLLVLLLDCESQKSTLMSMIFLNRALATNCNRDFVSMGGLPARKYLKTVAYKDQIPQFKAVLTDIGKGQGWELDDLKARFSNELWDEIVFS